jgi:5-(carboxyamino)imidazole ribonucleotide synthase
VSVHGFNRLGIVGAGQLGRMMALAAYPLGIRTLFLDRADGTPGAQVAPSLVGGLEDPERLAELAARSDVITFDWENIAAPALAPLDARVAIRPSAAALALAQDRIDEKALFSRLKIPVAAHAPVDSGKDLERAVRRIGVPGVLKTRRLGYDGKGQVLIGRAADCAAAWERLGPTGLDPGLGLTGPGPGNGLIYERFQPFSREISLIGARDAAGRTVFYPLCANTHAGGVLRYTIAPYNHARLAREARSHLTKVMNSLDYCGVLTIEFFVVAGRLIANEMAPRVHNSGHWTIEGSATSQFENHVRAVCNLPLGSTRPLGHAAMINFLGNLPPRDRLLKIEGLAYHDYGKSARPGRKVGHCTIVAARAADRSRRMADALKLIRWT